MLTPGSHAFGPVDVGDPSPTFDFTLANTGDVDLDISSIGTTGSSTFSVSAEDCPVTLAAGDDCTITVRFAPAGSAGNRNGQLAVASDADNGTVQSTLSGTVVIPPAPVAQLNPSSSDFDDVVVAASKTRHFTLTNIGGADLTITDIGVDGDPADWAVDSTDCVNPMGSGADCDIAVTFTPSATGTQHVVLRVTSDATNDPRTSNLTGNGVNPAPAPVASVSPSTQEFTVASAPGSDAHDFTITNTGTGSLVVDTGVTSLKTTGSSWFSVTANTCTSGLAHNETCTVTVTFTAPGAGDKNGTLHVPSNATNGEVTADLHGTATVPAGPQAHATITNGSPYTFTGVVIGTTGSHTFHVTNDGDDGSTLTVTGATLTGSARFGVDDHPCATPLAKDDVCDITVEFTPTNTDHKSATLTVITDANDPTVDVDGTGVAADVATADLSPGSYDFGNVDVGDSQSHLFVLTNTGTAQLASISVSISGSVKFTLDTAATDPCGSTLAAGASCNIKVVFAPTATGDRNATLKVASNASNGLQTTDLAGTGVNPAPTLTASITPASYDYGELPFGTTKSKTFVVENTGTGTVHVINKALSGSGFFSSTADGCTGAALTAGDTCSITIKFTAPSTPLTKNGTLTVHTTETADLVATYTGKSVPFAGQPDGTVSKDGDHEADYIGRNSYCSKECSSQTQTVQSSKGKTVPFWFRVYNNGNVTDTFKVVGRVGGSTSIFQKVVIKRNDVDITDAVLNGTYKVQSLNKGKFAQFRVWVTLKSNADPGLTTKFWLTFSSTVQKSKTDVVRAQTKS